MIPGTKPGDDVTVSNDVESSDSPTDESIARSTHREDPEGDKRKTNRQSNFTLREKCESFIICGRSVIFVHLSYNHFYLGPLERTRNSSIDLFLLFQVRSR